MVTELDQMTEPKGEQRSKTEEKISEEDIQGELEHEEAINSLQYERNMEQTVNTVTENVDENSKKKG